MIQIKVLDGQTIYDIAKQYYGNIEAVSEILELNPDIRNNDIYLYAIDRPLLAGLKINIDEKSKKRDANTLRNIHKNIILWQERTKR